MLDSLLRPSWGILARNVDQALDPFQSGLSLQQVVGLGCGSVQFHCI